MHFIQLFLFFIFLSTLNADKATAGNKCQKKKYNRDSFVCVCNGQSCDTPSPIGQFGDNQLVYYVSDKADNRLERFVVDSGNAAHSSPSTINYELRLNASQQFQKIFGFGGAFTDSTGITLNSLSVPARQMLMRQYFSKESGIGYTVGRVPIASCDFSTHEYSYLDTPEDFNLTTFQLAKEDLEDKIPYILTAMGLSKGELKLFASPWSAPGWMKTTGKMKGGGQLKGQFNGKYYTTYANYFRRFFEEYAKRNVTFWGMTIENEPGAGEIPSYGWQAMYLSSKMQRDFAHDLLSPILKQSAAGKNVKIMAHDDQRNGILNAAKEIYSDPKKASVIDGLGSHWYSKSAYDVLQETHNLATDKFILATEACTGYEPWGHKPLLGEWSRGMAYGHDILNNLKNWVIGWTDWNMCLDLQGGPNWVGNYVDSPIIVNATADEFYKQPMFYFLAHFSNFVTRDSVVISSSLYAPNGTKLEDHPREAREMPSFLSDDKYFINVHEADDLNSQQIEHVAFRTPEGNRVLVLINPSLIKIINLTIREETCGTDSREWTIPIGPNSVVTAIWKKKN